MKKKLSLTEEISRMRSLVNLTQLNELDVSNRISASEFLQESADNVDTLIKLMSKYTPRDYWYVNIGFINTVDIPVTITPSQELADLSSDIDDPEIKDLTASDDWKSGKKLKNPYAPRTVKGEKVPSSMYKMKTYQCQWLSVDARNKMKSDKDAQILAKYKEYNIEPIEIDTTDKRGTGWSEVPETPFQKHTGWDGHDGTGNIRFVIYRKSGCYKDTKSKYFLKTNNAIRGLSENEANFYFKLANYNSEVKIPKRLMQIEDEKLREELWKIESMYDFKNIILDKIPFLSCTCVDKENSKNVRIKYINYDAAPEGAEKGSFKSFIEQEIVDTERFFK